MSRMRSGEERQDFEHRASELGAFLSGHKPTSVEDVTELDSQCFRRATVMLCAEELLEAAKYALALYQGLSTDDFAAGGDRPARLKLQNAVANATEWVPYNSASVEKIVRQDVQQAILTNPL